MDSPVRLMPPCSKCIARAHFGPGSAHLFVPACLRCLLRHTRVTLRSSRRSLRISFTPSLIHEDIPRGEFSSDDLTFNELLIHPTVSPDYVGATASLSSTTPSPQRAYDRYRLNRFADPQGLAARRRTLREATIPIPIACGGT